MSLVLAAAAKRKGIVARRRKTAPPSTTAPAHVRRAVMERDGGRCQVPLANGEICGSTYQVELGHLRPRARGGPTTVDNLRCESKSHDQRQADHDFGERFMRSVRSRSTRRRGDDLTPTGSAAPSVPAPGAT